MQNQRVGKRSIRIFPDWVKIEATTRVRGGESKASVSRGMNIPESTLRGWCKRGEEICDRARRISLASSNGSEPAVTQRERVFSDDDLAGPGPAKRRRTDNGVIDLPRAHQSTPLTRSSRKDSSSTDTASMNSDNINDTTSSAYRLLYPWFFQQQHLLGHHASMPFSPTFFDIATCYSVLLAHHSTSLARISSQDSSSNSTDTTTNTNDTTSSASSSDSLFSSRDAALYLRLFQQSQLLSTMLISPTVDDIGTLYCALVPPAPAHQQQTTMTLYQTDNEAHRALDLSKKTTDGETDTNDR